MALEDEDFIVISRPSTDDDFTVISRPNANEPNAFMRGFMGTLQRDNPQTLASTAEGLGQLTGYEGANKIASDLRSLAGRAPQELARQVPTLDAIKGDGVLDTASRALTYAGEAVGSGLGSTVPAIATGIAGGLAGRRAAGRTGAVVGSLAGAAVPSAALNYGDLYEAIKDEGVDPQRAAELAAYGVGPITGLDVIGVEGAASRIIGAGVRDAAIRGIAKRIVQEAGKGVAREGLTEAAQQVIQEAIAGTASGNDLLTAERGKRVLESGVQGALTGGAMGGASGIRSDAGLQQQQTGPVVGEADPPLVALPPTDRTRGDSFVTRSPEEAAARQAEADLLQRDIARMEKRVQGLILQAESSTDNDERSRLAGDIRQANRDLADAQAQYGQLAAPPAAASEAEATSLAPATTAPIADRSTQGRASPSAQTEALYDEAGQQIGRWNPATGEIIRDGEQAPAPLTESLPAPVTPADLASPLPTRYISEGKAIISELLGERPQRPAIADQAPAVTTPAPAPAISQEAPAQAGAVPARPEPLAAEQADPVEVAARRIDPRAFAEYDRLATRAESYRQWLADMQAQKMRDIQAGTESPQAIRDLQAEIDQTQARIPDATPRMKKKLSQRIEDMTARRDELARAFDTERAGLIEAARPQDTADMARVRQVLIKTDAQMRDMASAMAAARSQARVTLGLDPMPAPTQAAPAMTNRARLRGIEPADAAGPAPIMRTDGAPYGSEKSAAMSARQRPDLKGRDLEPVKVKGGWGLRERGQSPDRVAVPSATAAAALPSAPAAQELRIVDRQEALPVTLPAPATASIIAAPAEPRRNVAQAQQEAAQAIPAPASPIAPAVTRTPAPAERSPAPAQVEPPAAVASPPSGASSPEASASAKADPIAFRASMAKPQATVAALEPVTRQAAIADFVRKVQSDAVGEASIDLGPTTIADRIKTETGIDVAGFTHVLDRSGIRHAIKQHGDPKREAARGQVPVTEADFAKLPDVLANPDTIENAGKTKQGRDAIRYSKAIGDQIFYVEEVRTGRKRLAPVTMYKRLIEGGRAATPDAPQPAAPAASPAQTPEAFRGPVDNMAQVEAEGNQPAPATTAPMPAASRTRKPKPPTMVDRLENYFRPGRIVPGYGGTQNEVIAFQRGETPDRWSVRVRAVDPDGRPLQGPDGWERSHSTQPDTRTLERWEKDNPVPGPGPQSLRQDRQGPAPSATAGGGGRESGLQGRAEDLASFLARNGGIRDDEGHSLRKQRNLQRMTQHGPMIRERGGLSLDDAGEALWQEGFFGPVEETARPTEARVLDLLERLQTERRVYRPEESEAVSAAATDARAREVTQAAREDIRGIARDIGERLSATEIDEIIDIMGERSIDAEAALSDYIERKAIVAADRAVAQSGDDTYADDIPFEGLASDSRQSGARSTGSAPDARRAGGISKGGPSVAEGEGTGRGQGQPVTPRTERTDQGEQFVLPGATRVQDSGGRLRGKVRQKAADEGLFAPPESRQDELFAIAPQVTDSFAAAAPEIERNLKARLDRLGLSDRVGLRVTDMIRSLVSGQDMPGAVGMFSSTDTQRLIQVSTAAPSPGAILHHEALHAMRSMGLFSPREWQVLERAARADRERAARIERAYAGQIADMPATERAELLTEETIADMYGDWSDGRLQARGALETLFQRIRNFLRALRNALAGAGFRTERDIFRAMDRGEIGSRQELPPMEPAERTQADNESRSERMAISSAANRTGLPPGLDLSTPRRSVVELLNDSSLPILQRLKSGGNREAISEQVDRWRRVMQDHFLPVLRTQAKVEAATGRKLDVSSDPYLQQELSTGRIGARLEDLTEQHVRPLYEDLHAAGISIEDLEAYLYARHAPERNARISSINSKFQPGEGSGMTDADAAAIMRGVRASGKQAAYEAAARRVDAILAMALETRVEAGLLSRQEADAWKATYKHYVPLRGKAELDPDVNADRPNKGGSGITVKGKESYRAFGRETKAADILGYSIMQAEEAIIRAETNEVAKAFYKLAKDNPDAGLWQVDKVEMRPVLDKASGQVRYQRASQISAEDKDYTVTAKIDGKEYRVTMNRENPVAVRLATAMRNLDGAQFGAWVRTVGSINRYLSTVNTTLNPEFMVVNAFRDLQTAGINLQQFDIPKMTRNTLKDYPAALKASMKGNFGKRDGSEWSKWYQEYRASGAPVSFNRMEDINAIRSRIKADFAAAGPGLSARKAWRSVWGTIENLNMGVEQAVRLAAYKNAREAGMSVERAASLAKNMTVNFNRKGSAGPIINSLYLFYNAGVQGTAALLSAAKSPRVRKVLYGAVLAGAALEMYNQMAGDDDDDGESFYRKISENDKQRNLIVMLPGQGGNHLKIPLPYGYNVFFTLGRLGIATATGEKNAARAGTDLLTAVMDSFNPIGGSGSLLNIIAPTIADPVVDLTRNRDYADRPIAPEPSPYTTPEPDSSTYWNNVSTPSKAFTAWLNEATGGDDVQPGAIDISPETLDYMAGFATGAAGSFFGRITDLGAKLLDPQGEVTVNDLPLTRKVLGGKPGWYDKSAFYERAKKVDEAVDFLKRYEEAGNTAAADRYAAEKAKLLDMEKPVRQARKALSAIRKERAALRQDLDQGRIDRAAYDKEMDALKADEQAELLAFNADYLSWVGKE